VLSSRRYGQSFSDFLAEQRARDSNNDTDWVSDGGGSGEWGGGSGDRGMEWDADAGFDGYGDGDGDATLDDDDNPDEWAGEADPIELVDVHTATLTSLWIAFWNYLAPVGLLSFLWTQAGAR